MLIYNDREILIETGRTYLVWKCEKCNNERSALTTKKVLCLICGGKESAKWMRKKLNAKSVYGYSIKEHYP